MSGEVERIVFFNIFLAVFWWTLVRDKKDSGKWNTIRDKSLAARFIFVVFLFFKYSRARAICTHASRTKKKNYIEPP